MSAKAIYACFPPTVRGQPSPIKTNAKGDTLVYALGRLVVIREAQPQPDRPVHVQLYTEHAYTVTAVAMAPSGCYVASGDANGTVRVWACDTPEQVLKLETAVFSGAVLDIAWSADSQRIVAVGNGQQSYAKVFMWDSGNTVGDILGHAKKITTCSFKHSRPFRIATGGDDLAVNLHAGPPFKFQACLKKHERFVNCVRFSPDGERILSAASDMFIAVFGGKEGELIVEKKVAGGSLYAAAWSADSARIAVAAADKTVRVLEAGTLSELSCHTFGKSVEHMQVGCVWGAAGIFSYSLGGELSLLDPANAAAGPTLVQYGHNKAVSALCYTGGFLISGSFSSIDEEGSTTSSSKGCMRAWDLATGLAKPFAGDGHTARVIAVGALADGAVVSVGGDDSIVVSAVRDGKPTHETKLPLSAAPRALGCGGRTAAVVLASDKLALLQGGEVKQHALPFSSACVAVDGTDACIAVGADGMGDNNNIYIYSPAGAVQRTLSKHRGGISALAFSPGSDKLASGCANKEIVVWDPMAGTPLVTGIQGYHTTRISALVWSPASVLASGGVDATINVWNLETKKTTRSIKLAHQGGVTALAFVAEDTLASAGQDACIKTWTA